MTAKKENRFNVIALEMNFIDQVALDSALAVQAHVFKKTQMNVPIDAILIKMGFLSPDKRDEIIRMQRKFDSDTTAGNKPETPEKKDKPARPAKKDGSTLDIDVSKDKLMALVHIDGDVRATMFDINDVQIMLHSYGILHGIADDAQIKAFLNGEFSVGEQWTIASGTKPIPDTPPHTNYHFDTDPIKIGTLTEDGLMDWKDRGQLPQVKEGDLLAEKIPGPKGEAGIDVYGKTIPIPKLRVQRFKCGKGVRRSADGMQVHAKLSGLPTLSITGEISVMPTLHIEGNISIETGHVEFDGHIDVAGAVEKGYRVKGSSLRVDEIHEAHIEIDGDITAINGIFGSTIRSGGNLKAGHIHNTDIILAGDIAVEKEIIESKIEANGRCLIIDGIIISSTVSAKMGISAMEIGTKASKPSELIVGIDRQLERAADAVKTEIQAIKAALENRPKLLKNLKKQSDQLNTRLGEVAQLQDKCMVQRRHLQEKVEAGLLKKGSAAAEKLQKNITELKANQDAYDQDVARLMDEDESIGREIAETETAIAESATTLQALNAKLDVITETQERNHGVAMVKLGGNIFSGSKVTGPHSARVLREDLKRLSIVETDKPDHDGAKRWRFDLNPFR